VKLNEPELAGARLAERRMKLAAMVLTEVLGSRARWGEPSMAGSVSTSL